MSTMADTMRFILERDETAFARILRGHLDGETAQETASALHKRGLVMDASMVRAYTKSIAVIVDGDTSGVTANEANHVGGKMRYLLSMDPPPNVDAHLRRVLDELGQDAGSGMVPGVTTSRRRRREPPKCPRCEEFHVGECV